MSIQSISTKELREELPRIRAGLARGDEFLLIYRSKPIARLEPIQPTAPAPTELKAGGLRLQEQVGRELTPEYLQGIISHRYDE